MKTQIMLLSALLLLFSISSSSAEDFEVLAIITGDEVGDEFYHICNGHGDINGDGFGDLIIGGPDGDGGWGLVKIFLGSIPIDTIPDAILLHIHGGGYGASTAIGGDFNGDGYDDFLIGSPGVSIGYPSSGAAYLHLGGLTINTEPELMFAGTGFYHGLGRVTSPGDVNNDGFDDWLISENDMWPHGFAHLYMGGSILDSIPELTFSKSGVNHLTFDGSQLGDVNGDGFDDIILYDSESETVEIHCGQTQMDTIPELRWWGDYGKPACGIGDVNGDGYNDWLKKKSHDRLCIYFGSANLDSIPDMMIYAEGSVSSFYNEAAGGDIDGDGYCDFVIGAYDTTGNMTGQVVGYRGGPELDEHYDYMIDSGINNTRLGTTIGLADLDGDNIMEVLAGASQYTPPFNYGPGQVWVLAAPHVSSAPRLTLDPRGGSQISIGPNPFNP
ncbi:integrin alpha, partial [bacterium]|nr:integrin alpha [bacterium]